MPRSLLVTGAGGFIGRYVVECARALGPATQVVALDRAGRENPVAHHAVSCELISENQVQIAQLVQRFDISAVVHCAGSASPDYPSLVRDNLVATRVLIEALARTRPGLPFCHLGSSAEYTPLDRPRRTSEDTPEQPSSDYGKVKLQTTQAVLKTASEGDVCGYVLRLFNPIGAGMAEANLVGRVCAHLRDGQEAVLRVGRLDSYRDYIDIRDVARAVVSSLERASSLAGRVVNIGTGTAHSTRDLVQGLLGFSPRPVAVEESAPGSSRSEAMHWQEADIARAGRWLEWQPKIVFARTVEDIALHCVNVRHR